MLTPDLGGVRLVCFRTNLGQALVCTPPLFGPSEFIINTSLDKALIERKTTMKSSSIKFALSSVVMAAGMALSTSASAYLPLALTSFEANTDFTLSVEAFGSTTAAGFTFAPLGNTIQMPDVELIDSDGVPTMVPMFRFPVTKTDVNLGGAGGLVTPNTGYVVGSALRVSSKQGDVALANLGVDFNKKVVVADVLDIKAQTTAKASPIFNFNLVSQPKLALKGLGLNLEANLDTMILTDAAVPQLATALKVNDVLKAALISLNWGKIHVLVTSKTRKTKTPSAAFTLKQVK
jgi:hypothetical protein